MTRPFSVSRGMEIGFDCSYSESQQSFLKEFHNVWQQRMKDLQAGVAPRKRIANYAANDRAIGEAKMHFTGCSMGPSTLPRQLPIHHYNSIILDHLTYVEHLLG
ncbi:MAG: hypothetical protein GY820_05640 [Gammaproteobacteria bacterium]|nr:hypothetical protein [Gammaproteobacteria bacterium]